MEGGSHPLDASSQWKQMKRLSTILHLRSIDFTTVYLDGLQLSRVSHYGLSHHHHQLENLELMLLRTEPGICKYVVSPSACIRFYWKLKRPYSSERFHPQISKQNEVDFFVGSQFHTAVDWDHVRIAVVLKRKQEWAVRGRRDAKKAYEALHLPGNKTWAYSFSLSCSHSAWLKGRQFQKELFEAFLFWNQRMAELQPLPKWEAALYWIRPLGRLDMYYFVCSVGFQNKVFHIPCQKRTLAGDDLGLSREPSTCKAFALPQSNEHNHAAACYFIRPMVQLGQH